MTMKKFLKVIQLAEAVVRFTETILHIKFIDTILHDMNKDKEDTQDKDEMPKMLDAMASLVHKVGTSQFFTKQLWKDEMPDTTTPQVLSVFITNTLYDHGVYAYYTPWSGFEESDKQHVSSFLNKNREVLEKYAKWSRGGKR